MSLTEHPCTAARGPAFAARALLLLPAPEEEKKRHVHHVWQQDKEAGNGQYRFRVEDCIISYTTIEDDSQARSLAGNISTYTC
jgi:hypothetical protein